MSSNMASKITPSKVLSQETVYESKYFVVKKLELEFHKKKITKEIVYRLPVVYILAVNENNEIYLVKQYRDALRTVSTEVVAGTLDPNEDPLVAARRELFEETGLSASDWEKIGLLDLAANTFNKAHVFVARGLKAGKANFDSDEFIETVKVPINKVPSMIEKGELVHAPSIAAIYMMINSNKKNKNE